MKLELHHLAPYLPYGVSLQTPDNISEMVSIIGCDPFFEIKDYTSEDEVLLRVASNDFWNFATWGISQIKPILRPLSDFTKEIEHNGVRFVPIDYHAFKTDKAHLIEYQNKFAHFKSVKYGILERLFEWHFDVFGLIDKNLAIDINTIKP